MKLATSIFITFGFLFLSTTTYAADAGCGLGSMIIQKNSKGLQLLAMTTNSYFLTQPLGITSGTSGCSASGLVMNDQQIEYFVEVNQEDLSREMAVGKGEKLHVLAQLHGCTSTVAQNEFAGMAQASFSKIIPSANTAAQDVVKNIKSEMNQNTKLTELCQVAAL